MFASDSGPEAPEEDEEEAPSCSDAQGLGLGVWWVGVALGARALG